MTNPHLSGIGIYNRNLYLELHKLLADTECGNHLELCPVLKWTRIKKKSLVEKHIQTRSIKTLWPMVFDKLSIYHGPDYKLNTKSFGKNVVTIHDMQAYMGKWLDPKFAAQKIYIINKTLSGPLDKIIAVSEFTKNEIIKVAPHLESKIEVIYHGCDFDHQSEFAPSMIKEKINGRPFLFSIGHIEERKNLINQIKAFELLKAEFPELVYVLAGRPGFGAAFIFDYIAKSKAKDDIFYFDYINNSEKYFALKNTSCLMFASHYEGFGIPAIEALHFNSGVLISKTPCLEEIVGSFCHSTHPENIEEMAAVTRHILKNGNKVKINSSEWIKKWSWTETAKKTLKLYQSLI